MSAQMVDDTAQLNQKNLKQRNWATLLSLLALVVLVFAISIVRLQAGADKFGEENQAIMQEAEQQEAVVPTAVAPSSDAVE